LAGGTAWVLGEKPFDVVRYAALHDVLNVLLLYVFSW
jgi:hypothetical protein